MTFRSAATRRSVLCPARDFRSLCFALCLPLGLSALGSGVARAEEAPPPDKAGTWTIQVENDAVSTLRGTSDQYYTSGIRLGWTSGADEVPDFASRAANVLWGKGTNRISVDISQSIFSPRNTQLSVPNPHDRPYAGYLRGRFTLMQDQEDTRGLVAVSLGMIGPAALGEEVQNGFHSLIGQSSNKGWNHQIGNEPMLQVLSDRVWRLGITNVGPLETDALPELAISAGTERDYAMTGVRFRIGQGLNSDYGPARILPGMSGSDVFTATHPLAWYVFAGADGQAVGFDATLDGLPFGSSPHVRKKWLVGELEAGAGVIWNGLRITYTQTWQTEEFHGQKGGLFNFGSLAVSAKF